MGVSDIPPCKPYDLLCNLARNAVRAGVYSEWAQQNLVQVKRIVSPSRFPPTSLTPHPPCLVGKWPIRLSTTVTRPSLRDTSNQTTSFHPSTTNGPHHTKTRRTPRISLNSTPSSSSFSPRTAQSYPRKAPGSDRTRPSLRQSEKRRKTVGGRQLCRCASSHCITKIGLGCAHLMRVGVSCSCRATPSTCICPSSAGSRLLRNMLVRARNIVLYAVQYLLSTLVYLLVLLIELYSYHKVFCPWQWLC